MAATVSGDLTMSAAFLQTNQITPCLVQLRLQVGDPAFIQQTYHLFLLGPALQGENVGRSKSELELRVLSDRQCGIVNPCGIIMVMVEGSFSSISAKKSCWCWNELLINQHSPC